MWYVIQVMSGQEHNVAELCKLQQMRDGEEVFVPLYERKRKIKGKWELCQAILFPGYVFFQTNDVEALFYRLQDVQKLTRILKTGDEFTPLHETEVEFLMKFGKKAHIVEVSTGYIEGDKVVITSGPMADWDGKVKKIDRHKRVAVLEMDFFGRTTEVQVGLEIVEKKEQ